MNVIIRNRLFVLHRVRAIIGEGSQCLPTSQCQICTRIRQLNTSSRQCTTQDGQAAQNFEEDNSTPGEHRHSSRNTIDPTEVDKFSRIAQSWWTPSGEFQALHNLNELRVPLIRDALQEHKDGTPDKTLKPLSGVHILDIGCGGGILSEPLARLGANVTGVDASMENIEMATWHAQLDKRLSSYLRYKCCAVEDLASDEEATYDGVVASEILEHVANQQQFVTTCCSLVRPGGSLFITTLNKTWLSYTIGVVAAEHLLKIVPAGSHDWNKFVPPSTLKSWLSEAGFHTALLHGMTMNPVSQRWCWIRDTSINYAIHAMKQH